MKAFLAEYTIRTFGPMKYFSLRRIIEEEIKRTNTKYGLVTVHVKGSTAGILIIDEDMLGEFNDFLTSLIPVKGWSHGNAYAHLRSFIVSSTKTIYYENDKLLLPENYQVYLMETRPVHNHRRKIHLVIRGV